MNKYLILVFALYLFCSCNNNGGHSDSSQDTADATPAFYRWEATDSIGKLKMKKVEDEGPDTLSPVAVVTWINKFNVIIKLELLRISRDTIYLAIPDASNLTQQQGSAGATMMLAGIVYNLTEIPGIRYVNLDFEQGDHAAPGTFDRGTFKNE
jgi:hypothetical protein